jgi:dihydropyrimidine dehydrogenase (NADP+)/dihydropyrimidine dehydrogenase (NAD+) subunit PreA
MTPNITHIEEPSRAALRAGCQGISAINTLRCVMGINLDTLRPEPSVEGFSTPGGYSSKAIRPIALRMVMEIATMMAREFPGRSLSGIGGVESGGDAAQFILVGADTVQELLAFMEKHKFNTLADFKGRSLPFFTTHFDLVQKQARRKAAQKAAQSSSPSPRLRGEGRGEVSPSAVPKKVVSSDAEWRGDSFVQQSHDLSRD